MKTFFKQLLSDESGAYSSKRLSGLLCIFALVACLIANTFSPEEIRPAEYLSRCCSFICIWCIRSYINGQV